MRIPYTHKLLSCRCIKLVVSLTLPAALLKSLDKLPFCGRYLSLGARKESPRCRWQMGLPTNHELGSDASGQRLTAEFALLMQREEFEVGASRREAMLP